MNRGAAPHLSLAPHSSRLPSSSSRLGLSFHHDIHLTRGPLWRRVTRRFDPTPPPPKPSPPPPHRLHSDFDTWKAGLTRRLGIDPKPVPAARLKPEPEPEEPSAAASKHHQQQPDPTKQSDDKKKWEADWKGKKEDSDDDKKKKEGERKVDPEEREPKQHEERRRRRPEASLVRQDSDTTTVSGMKSEQQQQQQLQDKKPNEPPMWKRTVNNNNNNNTEKPPKTETDTKPPEPIRKRPPISLKVPQEAERKVQEPESKPEEPEKKTEPYWKRKHEFQQKDLEQGKKKEEPNWKRKWEPEVKKEAERKWEPRRQPPTEPEKKPETPLWKRKLEPNGQVVDQLLKPSLPKQTLKENSVTTKKLELDQRKTETQKKPEIPWKQKQDLLKKTTTTEAGKEEKKPTEPEKKSRPQPLWKQKKEQENQQEKQRAAEALQKNNNNSSSSNSSSSAIQPDDADKHSDFDSDLHCPLCSELYDGEEDNQQPVLLPRCGHTFCRACLLRVKNKGHFPCPTCRKRHLKPPVEQLPLEADLLKRAETFRDDKLGRCDRHSDVLAFWCRDCDYALCGKCKVLPGHSTLKTRILLKEKRQELTQQGQDILESVDQEKQKILDSVKTCSVQLLKVCEASTVAEDSAQDIKGMMSDTKQTADIKFLMGSLKRMKSILGSLAGRGVTSASTSSDTEMEKDSETPRVRRRRREMSPKVDSVRTRSQSTDNKLNITNKMSATPQPAGHQYPHQMGISGLTGEQQARLSSEGPLKGLGDASLWPLTCCVYGEDGRRARLAWESGRLHMWALGDEQYDAHFMIKLAVLQSVISQDNPEVFLDLGVGEKKLGRVYIRLWGYLRRAHNYLAMCMGTHGPSYRGAKFEEVFSRGLKGECLHAGPYPTPDGTLSAQGVMDQLEWDGKYKGVQRQGLVVGAGSGRPDRDSCFDICTIENRDRHFACPFGEVVGGWDVVLAARDHRPVRAVTMVDVGVVVPDLTTASLAPPQSPPPPVK